MGGEEICDVDGAVVVAVHACDEVGAVVCHDHGVEGEVFVFVVGG